MILSRKKSDLSQSQICRPDYHARHLSGLLCTISRWSLPFGGGGHQSQKKYTSSANIFGDIIKPHSHNRLCLFHTSHKRDEYKEMANVNIRVKTHTYSFLLFSDDIWKWAVWWRIFPLASLISMCYQFSIDFNY